MLNRVSLIGNLGADPDVHYGAGDRIVVNIRLATSRKWKDKITGQSCEQTEWHRVVFFNKLAEIGKEYFRKGQQIYVEGRLHTKKWQGKDNQDRYTTEIIAQEMQMLGKRHRDLENQPSNIPAISSIQDISHEGFLDDVPF